MGTDYLELPAGRSSSVRDVKTSDNKASNDTDNDALNDTDSDALNYTD